MLLLPRLRCLTLLALAFSMVMPVLVDDASAVILPSGFQQTTVFSAVDAGLAEVIGVGVGGGSDGNFTAAIGVPTLDGLGAIGANGSEVPSGLQQILSGDSEDAARVRFGLFRRGLDLGKAKAIDTYEAKAKAERPWA